MLQNDFPFEPDDDNVCSTDTIMTGVRSTCWCRTWGAWPTSLGQEMGLVAASVTVETAPDLGTRLEREVEAPLDGSRLWQSRSSGI